MTEEVRLPTYETLLTEAIRSLAVDSGTVTTPAAIGTNVLRDATKKWGPGIHKNRLVKIIRGAGAGQMAVILDNADKALVIKQNWAVALDTTSVYVILDVDIVSEFAALKEALSRVLEVSEDSGTATGGSNTTVVDTSKNWAADMWANAVVHVIHGGIEYVRLCSSNTADTLTIAALPAGIAVTAGDAYAIRRPVTIADITDRTTREIGIVDSLTKWGGATLTGRDISLDLKALTDDSIKGLLKSIGDVAALENLITRIGQTTDAIVAAGAAGSISAKLRRVTQGLEDLKTLAGAGQAPVGVTVTAASTQILDANANRKAAVICNDSDTTIYLAIGVAAVANQGIRLNANGGVIVISRTGDIFSTEAIYGILAAVGNKVATAQELN